MTDMTVIPASHFTAAIAAKPMGPGTWYPGSIFPRFLVCLLVMLLSVSIPAPASADNTPQPPGVSRAEAAGIMASHFARAQQLMAEGRVAEALPILERLVTLAPDVPAFRLTLAQALFTLRQDDRAAYHFDLARGARLTDRDRAAVDGYLAQIDARNRWEASLTFGLSPQSNMGKRTSQDSVVIGGLDFVLNPDARARSGTGLTFSTAIGWRQPLDGRNRLRLGLSANGYLYDDSRFNDVRLRFQAGLEHQAANATRVDGGIALTRRWVADRAYSDGFALWAGLTTDTGPRSRLTLRGQAELVRHDTAAGLDGHRASLSLGMRHALAPSVALNWSVGLERVVARTAADSSTGVSLSLGMTRAFAGGVIAGIDLGARQQRHDGADRLFGETQLDRTYSVSARVLRRDLIIAGFAPMIELTHERRHSNIPIADYTNNSIGLLLTRNF